MKPTRFLVLLATLAMFVSSAPAAADHLKQGLKHNHWHLGGGSLSFAFRPRLAVHRSFGVSVGYPSYSAGYGGYSDPYFYGYSNPYGIYYNPQSNYAEYYLPPLYVPPELMYGPQAMDRFLGIRRAPNPIIVVEPAVPAPKPRVSNVESRRRASHFIASGDARFREQRYHEALQEYKTAAGAAPDVAEAYFRQGHALVATARYELAAAAFKRAAAIDPAWTRGDFRLDDLYGDTHIAKTSHVEALARAALEKSEDANLLMLLGIFLHYDGQAERAQKFLQRAASVAAPDAVYVRGLLRERKPSADVKADEGFDT